MRSGDAVMGRTVKWNGSAGDGRMSTGANWDGGTAPAAGDTLDFSAVMEGDTIIADIANTTFYTITFGSRKFSVAGALTLIELWRPYLMSVETGATVTVGTLYSGRDEDYYLDRLDGTFVVTGEFHCNDSKTYGSSTARCLYRSGGGAFVVNKFRFGWNGNDGYMTADGTHLVLGSGGFEIGKKCFMYAKNATIGCTSDITLSRRSDMDPDNAGGQSTIHEGVDGSSLVLDTGDFYNPSVGHKITVEGLISGWLAKADWPCLYASGFFPERRRREDASEPWLKDFALESFVGAHSVIDVAPGGKTYRLMMVSAADESRRILGAYDFVSGSAMG